MAGKINIVGGTSEKTQYRIDLPRADIARIEVLDIDFVIETKGGDRLILPGAALEAMNSEPSTIQFTDGAVSSAALLAEVGKVDTRTLPIPVMASMAEELKKTSEGKKNVVRDGPEGTKAEEALDRDQQVAPLDSHGAESTVDKLVNKAQEMELAIRNNLVEPVPVKPFEPIQPITQVSSGSEPKTSKIPIVIALAQGNVVGVSEDDASARNGGDGGKIILGAGGPAGSDTIMVDDPNQYGTETLAGGDGSDEIYADGFAQLGHHNTPATFADGHVDRNDGRSYDQTPLYYAKEFHLSIAGYIRAINTVAVSLTRTDGTRIASDAFAIDGLPAQANGDWALPADWVVPTSRPFTLTYDVTKVKALGLGDVFFCFDVSYTGDAGTKQQIQKFVLRFTDVGDVSGVTNNPPVSVPGSGWSAVYVMPTASAPHKIDAGDGHNLVHGANSNDTITAGAGNDTLYAYAGDDIIDAGNGHNTVYAGFGNDRVTTGTGNDVIEVGDGINVIDAGSGNNVITAGSGDDTIATGSGTDAVTAGAGSNTITDGGGTNTIVTSADSGTDIVTITGDGNNTITVGVENDDIADGDDTVITQSGIDIIHVGDGDNVVTTGNGRKEVSAGSGNDSVTTGTGDDTIAAGDGTNVIDAGSGNNVVTAGSGNDSVATGTGNDRIELGGGSNTVTDGGGSNTITATGIEVEASLDPVVIAQTATDIVTITGDGNNTITFGVENDDIADGDDTVITQSGIDIIHVGDGDNVVTTGNGRKEVSAGSGNDRVTTGSGDDTIAVGDGTNIVLAGSGANRITAGSGNDTLVGGSGADSIVAGAGDDFLYGGAGANTMLDGGGGTNDWLSFNGIASTVTDAAATLADWLAYAGTDINGVVLALDASGGGTATHGGDTDTVAGVENLIGSSGNDTLDVQLYAGIAHIVYGLGGHDSLMGADGADSLYGGEGNDWIQGLAGNDIIDVGRDEDVAPASIAYTNALGVGYTVNNWVDGGAGADTISGGGGRDYFYAKTNEYVDGDGNVDSFDGGLGTDTVDFSSFTANLTITATDTKIGSTLVARYSNIEELIGGTGNDVLTGSVGDDTLFGGAGNDTLNGSAGANVLDGGAGTNTYNMGTGADRVVGGANYDRVYYQNSPIAVVVNLDSVSHSFVNSLGATITVAAGSGGNRQEVAADANSWANDDSYSGVEEVQAGSGSDVVWGDAGNNVYYLNGGTDVGYGLGGNDTFYVNGAGNKTFDGGDHSAVTLASGGDTIDYNNINAYLSITLDTDGTGATGYLGTVTGYGAYTTTLIDVENAYGGNYADIIVGSAAANRIDGRSGNDTVTAGGGDDFILAASGSDVIDGGTGTDTVSYSGYGSTAGSNGLGVEVYLEDVDLTAYGVNAKSTWTNNTTKEARYAAPGGAVEYDDLTGIENVVGTDTHDRLIGDSSVNAIWGMNGNDIIDGRDGNDTLDGGAGNDTIWGGDGDDVIEGGANNDSLYGGGGIDTVSYLTATSAVVVNLATSAATGGGGADILSGFENVRGGTFADRLTGDGGANTLWGDAGNDTLVGGAGNDMLDGGGDSDMADYSYVTNAGVSVVASLVTSLATISSGGDNDSFVGIENLRGGSGNDTLTGDTGINTVYGGAGNDVIDSSGGADSLYGEAGNDTFIALVPTDVAVLDGGSGTDTLSASGWTFAGGAFSNTATWVSIEEINVRDSGSSDSYSLQATDIRNIVDVGNASRLTLRLDSGDTFTADVTSGGSATSTGIAGGTRYSYFTGAGGAGTLQAQVDVLTTG